MQEAQRRQDMQRVAACRPKLKLAGHSVQWQWVRSQLGRPKLPADRYAALVGVIAGDAVPETTVACVRRAGRPPAPVVAWPPAACPQGPGISSSRRSGSGGKPCPGLTGRASPAAASTTWTGVASDLGSPRCEWQLGRWWPETAKIGGAGPGLAREPKPSAERSWQQSATCSAPPPRGSSSRTASASRRSAGGSWPASSLGRSC